MGWLAETLKTYTYFINVFVLPKNLSKYYISWNFYFWENGINFSYSSYQVHNAENELKKTLKNTQSRVVKGLETQGITTGEFSIFSFCLLYIICRAKEARNLEMLMGRHRGKKMSYLCVYVCVCVWKRHLATQDVSLALCTSSVPSVPALHTPYSHDWPSLLIMEPKQ